MDNLDLGILIAGALVPFLFSIFKRWIVLSKEQMGVLVIIICFVIASVFELIGSGFNWEIYVTNIMKVYGISQAIYWGVIKILKLDTVIEGVRES